MNLELINRVFHDLFDDQLSIFIYAAKFIGVLLFMFTIGKKLMQNFSTKGMSFDKTKEGLNPYDILRALILLAAIISITEILTLFDNILLVIENIGISEYKEDLSPLALYNVPLEDPNTGSSTIDLVLRYLRNINEKLNPVSFALKGLYIILWLVDIILFVVFIAQRFFFMGVIKLFAPIIIGLSILPEYREMSYNLGKVYLRNFLIIIPYLLVFVFANKIHDALVAAGEEIGGGVGTFGMVLGAGLTVRVVALLASVVIKAMLLKKSGDFMKQLIA